MNNTLKYYNTKANQFISDTVNIEFNDMHQMLLKYLPHNAYIFDMGCGSGRDSKTFQSQGYKVLAMDGSIKMCKAASQLLGTEVVHQRFNEIEYDHLFDGIWACASLLHVPYNELPAVFNKITKALKQGGYVYMSFKYSDFEGERNGRYFTDLNEDRLAHIMKTVDGLQLVETKITHDVRPGRENEKWLNVIFKKK